MSRRIDLDLAAPALYFEVRYLDGVTEPEDPLASRDDAESFADAMREQGHKCTVEPVTIPAGEALVLDLRRRMFGTAYADAEAEVRAAMAATPGWLTQ